MGKKDYMEQYESRVYQVETDRWMQAVLQIVLDDKNKVAAKVKESISDFMEKVAMMQTFQPIPVGLITISFMRTGIWEEKPRIRIDAYDVNQEAGVNLASQYIDAGWFAKPWKEYKDALQKGVKDLELEQYIRAARIEQSMSKSIDRFVKTMMVAWKYEFLDFDKIRGYEQMRKEEIFLLTVGEYLDAQKVMFATVPEIDLVAKPEEKGSLQRIEKCIYRDKEWKQVDWSRARFTDCEFSKCHFEQVDMRDVRFVNCLFRGDVFEDGILYGARFENCTFRDIEMKGMKMKWVPFADEREYESEIYREVEFIHCVRDDEAMEQKGVPEWNTL